MATTVRRLIQQNFFLLDVLEEHRRTLVLHELALRKTAVDRCCDWSVIFHVVGPQELLDVLGCLLCVIKGHLAEDVVAHVRVCYVVEYVIEHNTERAVDCAKSTAKEGPLLSTEVRNVRCSVLQVRDEYQIQVCDGKREQIVEGDGAEAVYIGGIDDGAQHCEESCVTLHDEPVILGSKELGSGGKVIRVLASVLCRSSCVKDQVSRHPSNCEHKEDAPYHCEGSLSQIILPIRASGRSEHLIVLTAASVIVVLAMGDSPAVVGNQEGRVEDGTEEVVPELALREGLVSALVR